MITIDDAGTVQLATAAELQAIITALSGDDAAANLLLQQATALIETLCGRALHEQTIIETFRPAGSIGRLIIYQWPVSTLTSVVENGEALTASDYELDGSLLYRLSTDERTTWALGKIVVTYTAGYTTATCPADLKRACLDIAVNLHAVEGRDQTMRSINIPDVRQISYRDPSNGGSVVPDNAMRVIDGYRSWRA